MISRGLDLDDFVWALDHSRRRYLVRECRRTDLSYFSDCNSAGRITVVGFHGGVDMVVIPFEAGLHSKDWVNSDDCARLLLKEFRSGQIFGNNGKIR